MSIFDDARDARRTMREVNGLTREVGRTARSVGQTYGEVVTVGDTAHERANRNRTGGVNSDTRLEAARLRNEQTMDRRDDYNDARSVTLERRPNDYSGARYADAGRGQVAGTAQPRQGGYNQNAANDTETRAPNGRVTEQRQSAPSQPVVRPLQDGDTMLDLRTAGNFPPQRRAELIATVDTVLGTDGRELSDGQRVVAYMTTVRPLIASMAAPSATQGVEETTRSFMSALGLDDSETSARLSQMLANATPAEKEAIKQQILGALNDLEARVPAADRAQFAPHFAEIRGSIDGLLDQATPPSASPSPQQQPQRDAGDSNKHTRLTAYEDIDFKDPNSPQAKALAMKIGQEKAELEGGFAGLFAGLLNRIGNILSGHPELNSQTADQMMAAAVAATPAVLTDDGLTRARAIAADPTLQPGAAHQPAATPAPSTATPAPAATQNVAALASTEVANWNGLSTAALPTNASVTAQLGGLTFASGTTEENKIKRVEQALGLTQDGKADAKLQAALNDPEVLNALRSSLQNVTVAQAAAPSGPASSPNAAQAQPATRGAAH